ncbi:uncharacterized protein LOC128555166 [Mercenaria mercenaria]|uniref:uncharacterized protein LOC128555166 n=1 Tax=Mercenaria mercenaria TaxID=6596 RepID=UPI00234FA0D6|nr:uncharacterized protein LOC128555166 [Mercenaria mercenaria]
MRKTVGMRSDVMEGIVQEFLSKWVPEEDQRNGKDDSITDKCESNKVCEEGEICNSVDIINFPSTQGDSKNDGTISCTAIGVTKTSIQKITDTEDHISGNGEISKESCKSDIGTDSNKIISSYIMDLKSNDECLKQFQKYVTACTNACWKAVISYPPVHLQFNLTGKNFKDVDEKYGLKKYTLNMPYRDTSKIHDEIALVVWPPSITYEYGGHEENVLATKNARVVVNFLDEC